MRMHSRWPNRHLWPENPWQAGSAMNRCARDTAYGSSAVPGAQPCLPSQPASSLPSDHVTWDSCHQMAGEGSLLCHSLMRVDSCESTGDDGSTGSLESVLDFDGQRIISCTQLEEQHEPGRKRGTRMSRRKEGAMKPGPVRLS
jgi:hypothetical protein